MRKLEKGFRPKQAFYIHQQDKEALTREQLLIFLAEGFTDCSYANDEHASFYIAGDDYINGEYFDPIAIFVIPNEIDVDFYIYDQDTGNEYKSTSIHQIIMDYKGILNDRRER